MQTKSLVFLLVLRVRRLGPLVSLDLKAKFRSNVDKASCFILLRTGSVSEGVGSSAARLLGLEFRIPLGAWVFVSCERCVLYR